MMQLAPRPLQGQLLTGSDLVRVIARQHPLRQARVERLLQPGLTVEECLREVLGAGADRPLVVHLNCDGRSAPLPRDAWRKVRPKPGTILTATPRLQNGGLKTILGLVIAIAALVIAPYAAGLIFAAGTTALTVGTAVIGAGLVLAGTYALNALFPTRPPQLNNPASQAFAQLPSIAGARNQATPFDVVPSLLGRSRVSPRKASKDFTEILGDDQHVCCLLVWGYGPIEVDQATFKIGETLLSSFSDYEVQHRAGYADDAPITLYPSIVDEQALAIVLSSSDGFVSRTTAPDADVFSFDVTAPQGVYQISTGKGGDGSFLVYQVAVAWRYRKVGDVAWTDGGGGTELLFNRSTGTQRIGKRFTPPARGQYEVALRKNTPDAPANGTIKDEVVWTALRSFTNDPPVTFDQPLAMTALRIKATDQLNGTIDTFNGEAVSLVTAYDGAAWSANTASQNCADLFRHVLQGPANARPKTDDEIDLDNLAAWWAECDDKGYKFNQVRVASGVSAYDALADIAAAGRAVPTFIDGRWGVVWDRPDDPIRQHFTPRNSWGFSGQRVYVQRPHAWRAKFINELNGWTEDERKIYDDGYDETNATLFESIEFPGVTDPDLIWKHGRFQIAQVRLRPEDVTLSTGWEQLVVTRGDRVHVTYDVLLIGQISGRIKSIGGAVDLDAFAPADVFAADDVFTAGSGGVITIDEAITIEAGKTYGFVFRTAADPSVVRAVAAGFPAGEYQPGADITLIGDLSALAAGDQFSFGETDQAAAVYRVKTIAGQKDLAAQLVLVDDAPEISEADQGAIPAYVPHVTLPVDPFTLPPQALQYIESVEGYGANATVLVRLSWTLPRRGKVQAFEVQNRDDNGDAIWRTAGTVAFPATSFDVPLIATGLWSYRVRCLFDDGTASAWSELPTINLQGLLAPPDEVGNFRATYNQVTGRINLTWDVLTDARGVLYEIRKGASWDAGLIVGEAITQPKFETVGDDTYLIAPYVVTAFGQKIYSEIKHSLAITGSVLTQNVVVSRDEKAIAWDGYFGGTVGRDDELGYIRTSGADNFLDATSIVSESDVLNAGGQGGGFYRSKVIVDAGREMPCRVSVDFQATGVPAAADFIGDADLLANPDFLQSYLTQFIRVYPVIRTGTAADADIFAPADIFAEDDAFAAGITFGDWEKWSPDVYVARFYQLGLVFEIIDDTVGAIAYALAFSWVVDVADRLDRYQGLTVPIGGLPIAFTPTGSDTATPFKGGINNEALPHILTDYVDRPSGYQVKVTDLTLTGCTVSVLNAAGADVGGDGINIMAQGYG